ncbi:MAG: hypothetical protein LLF76_10880 [Planctomycetaceae bacterium]|nr:hypothetical protein [Planctomycetaceae bacterium]
MEWLQPLVLWIIAAVALIYFGLGLFNVDWKLRIRILAALAIGAALIAGLGRPLVAPADPLGPVSMFTGEISASDAVILILLGFAAGILANIACYPLGGVLAPFAAPAGTAVLALTGGSMRVLLLYNKDFQARSHLYGFLRWEMLFWLVVCAAGLLGSILVSRLIKTKTIVIDGASPQTASSKWTNGLIGIVVTALVVYFALGIFAQDLRQMDPKLGSVIGLPGKGQVAFGVFVTVGLAAFLIKYLIRAGYLWAILGSMALYFVMFSKNAGSDTLQYLSSKWPVDFVQHSIFAITPLQFVSFAFLGALTGFWIAIRTAQKPESEVE